MPDPSSTPGPDDAILVVGGGIVGLTQAYMLCRRGHRVHLFESGAGFAGRASHANGGHLSAQAVTSLSRRDLGGERVRSFGAGPTMLLRFPALWASAKRKLGVGLAV